MVGMESWEKRGAQLLRYLGREAHPELQMGAVSALGDMPEREAGQALAGALGYLEGQNRELALDALVRNDTRAKLLLDLVEAGKLEGAALGKERQEKLLNHASEEIRSRAARLLEG